MDGSTEVNLSSKCRAWLLVHMGRELQPFGDINSQAVRLLQDHNLVGNNLSLVRAIDSYRNKCWATELIWIPRAANKPADSLAKCVDSLHPAISILEEPPDFLLPLLAADTSVSPS
ncbi:hypothetical protein V6N12_000903 [Hibiscus sabdariffa]|uniref:RNase H type-1 domain-containing protein n=1 Tax=Hibiscus sabdariffa TaxID=183260 RepID=A0ABR2BXL1_9ROSI